MEQGRHLALTARSSPALLLVRRRPVEVRQRHVVEPQVHGELSPVMYEVVQRVGAVGLIARLGEDHLALVLEGPRGRPGRVGHLEQFPPRLRRIPVEHRKERPGPLELPCHLRRDLLGVVELRVAERCRASVGQGGDVDREVAQGVRLGVRLPGGLGLGDAFEDLPGGGHFAVEFGKQKFGDGRHGVVLILGGGEMWDHGALEEHGEARRTAIVVALRTERRWPDHTQQRFSVSLRTLRELRGPTVVSGDRGLVLVSGRRRSSYDLGVD